jgi:hypothetical protein
MKFLRRLAALGLLLAPALGAALWSIYPAVSAALATVPPPPMAAADWDDGERRVDLRRQVQRHFLRHDVYIPLEDIIVVSPQDVEPGSPSLLMQKACGRGRLFVWIPLKFRLPITGEKVIEWCWKPQIKEPGASV